MIIHRLRGMLRLRLTMGLLIIWLSVLFNIERLHKPINIASFVYVLVGLTAVSIILLPKLRTATYVELTLLALPVYAFFKWYLGYGFWGEQLPITVTECFFICVTSFLASRVARQITDFLRSAGDLAMVERVRSSMSLKAGETRMYGEVQRARRFERPLAVATLAFTERFNAQQWVRLSEHARLEIARRFLETRVASMISELTDAGDIVVSDNNQFIIMFPERNQEEVREFLDGVVTTVKEKLGLDIRYGVANFPHEECTLTGLIERASKECKRELRNRPLNNGNDFSAVDRSVPPLASDFSAAEVRSGATGDRRSDLDRMTAIGVDERAVK